MDFDSWNWPELCVWVLDFGSWQISDKLSTPYKKTNNPVMIICTSIIHTLPATADIYPTIHYLPLIWDWVIGGWAKHFKLSKTDDLSCMPHIFHMHKVSFGVSTKTTSIRILFCHVKQRQLWCFLFSSCNLFNKQLNMFLKTVRCKGIFSTGRMI